MIVQHNKKRYSVEPGFGGDYHVYQRQGRGQSPAYVCTVCTFPSLGSWPNLRQLVKDTLKSRGL